jgi:DNA helicase II / ATP-dependent DNA helicase PcrA
MPSPTGLTLPSYWPAFDSKTQSLTARARSLYDAVRCCSRVDEGDVASRYQVLQGAVLEWMRRAGRKHTTRSGRTMSFNRAMLNSYLKESDKVLAFGEVMNSLVNERLPDEDAWAGIVEKLSSLLQLGELNETAAEFAAYGTCIGEDTDNEGSPRNPNIYDAVVGVQIALATIHSVKGETHDATLVCETKYRSWCDIQEMAEFLCNPEDTRPVADYTQPNSKETNRAAFMKRLFVAMSRPRYLLCLAIKKSHLTEAQRSLLKNAGGWIIADLTITNGSADS